MKFSKLEAWVDRHIAYVRLNDPENGNLFTPRLSQELLAVAEYISEADNIKVIVLGACGSDFSLGLYSSRSEETNEQYAAVRLACDAIERWARLPQPIIAVLHGQCISLGISLACVADIRYAARNTYFSVPEAGRGLVPAGGITQRLPRLIGRGPAMMMLLGGESLNASQALELGLVSKVTENDSAWTEALKEAERLATLSTLSLQYTKECLLRGSELSLEQALRLELDVYMLLQTSHDRMEGVRAFLEKRQPRFIGE